MELCIPFYSLLTFSNPAPLELLVLDIQTTAILMALSNTVAQTPFINKLCNPQHYNHISKE